MKIKSFIIVFSFLLSTFINAQLINDIKVPSSTGATLDQAKSEFYTYYSTYCLLNVDAQGLQYIWPTQNFSPSLSSWSQPMWAWNDFPNSECWPKWTAAMVIAYAQAYRFESDITKKDFYKTKAQRGAEFLLWLKEASGNNGGFPDKVENGYIDSERGVFTTGIAGNAFYECYLSFGDSKYKDALIQTAEWQLSNPSYPHLFPGDPTKYYSNVNHHAWPLKNLSLAYNIVGDQRYLDRAIQIAEEIIAWQDYIDSRNPWPSGSIPDGSWYWYDYSATTPLPNGVDPSPGGGFAAERKIDYHVITMDGLLELLRSTIQQVLPGTTTIRNNVAFTSFRNNLINSIIKGVNFIINNQETSTNQSQYRFSGMIQSFKDYKIYGSDYAFDGYNYSSAPHGITSCINSYIYLLKSNTLSQQDSDRLISLINSISASSVGKYNGGWGYNEWRVTMAMNWALYMQFKSTSSYSSILSLVNSSFEDKNIVWELWSWDGSGVNISNSYKKNGLNSARILDNNTNASKWASLLVSATPGVTYKAQAYARILNGRQSLYIHYYDQSYNLIDYGYSHIYANSDFQLVSLQRIAPSNAKYLRITLYADWYLTSEGYWDDVSLTTVLAKESQTTSEQIIPTTLLLENYPNPFNPSTTIYFELPERSTVTIKIYDVIGNEISTIINQVKEAGKYKINFNGEGLPSGVYFCTLQTKTELLKRKLLLLK